MQTFTNYITFLTQVQGYSGSEKYIGNAGERYGGMIMSCVSYVIFITSAFFSAIVGPKVHKYLRLSP